MFKLFCKSKLFFLFFIALIPQLLLADTVVNESVNISARVAGPYYSGYAGGTNNILNVMTDINFSGTASPLTKIYLLKDGQIVGNTTSDKNSNFSISLPGLTPNTYTFTLYSEDTKGNRSSIFLLTILIGRGTSVYVKDIILSPIIFLPKINPKPIIQDENKVNNIDDKKCTSSIKGDLNCDNYVNLTDFSIMLYWYNKPNPPKKIDLDGNNKINLADFSIMAYNWTN